MRWIVLALFPAIAACSSAPPAPRRAPQRDARCDGASTARVAVAIGETAAAGDLEIRFVTTLHDSYEDRSTDLLYQLELVPAGGALQPWLASGLAHDRFHVIADHCVRVVDGGSGRIVLDVGRLPSRYDDGTCAVACCPANDVAPSPTGEVECCFCR